MISLLKPEDLTIKMGVTGHFEKLKLLTTAIVMSWFSYFIAVMIVMFRKGNEIKEGGSLVKWRTAKMMMMMMKTLLRAGLGWPMARGCYQRAPVSSYDVWYIFPLYSRPELRNRLVTSILKKAPLFKQWILQRKITYSLLPSCVEILTFLPCHELRRGGREEKGGKLKRITQGWTRPPYSLVSLLVK